MQLHEQVAKLENDLKLACADRDALAADRDSWKSRYDNLTRCGITVGDGMTIYGDYDAVKRVQNYVLLSSQHPGEAESVNHALMRDLCKAEGKICNLRAQVASLTGEFLPKIDDLNLPAREEIAVVVEAFADALKNKLWRAEEKYNWNGHWKREAWQNELNACLAEHINKGDPLDVAAYCLFAHMHKWSVGPVLQNEMDDEELALKSEALTQGLFDHGFTTHDEMKQLLLKVFKEIRDSTKNEVRCTGCGSDRTNEEIAEGRKEGKWLSCCPERSPLNIDQWMERSNRLEIKYERYKSFIAVALSKLADAEALVKSDHLSTKRGVPIVTIFRRIAEFIRTERHKADTDE